MIPFLNAAAPTPSAAASALAGGGARGGGAAPQDAASSTAFGKLVARTGRDAGPEAGADASRLAGDADAAASTPAGTQDLAGPEGEASAAASSLADVGLAGPNGAGIVLTGAVAGQQQAGQTSFEQAQAGQPGASAPAALADRKVQLPSNGIAQTAADLIATAQTPTAPSPKSGEAGTSTSGSDGQGDAADGDGPAGEALAPVLPVPLSDTPPATVPALALSLAAAPAQGEADGNDSGDGGQVGTGAAAASSAASAHGAAARAAFDGAADADSAMGSADAAGPGIPRAAFASATKSSSDARKSAATGSHEAARVDPGTLRGEGVGSTSLASPVLTQTFAAAPTRPASLPYPVQSGANAPEAASVTVEAGRFGSDIGVQIARAVDKGSDDLLIKLDPRHLGRIDVRLSFDHDGVLRAVMSADSAGATDLLRREAGDLNRALAEAGIRADGQSLRFDTRAGQQQGQGGAFSGGHPSGGQSWRDGGAGRSAAIDQGAGGPAGFGGGDDPVYRSLSASGRVDLLA